MNNFAIYDERATALVLTITQAHLEIATDVQTLTIVPSDALDLLNWLQAHREQIEASRERPLEQLLANK